MISLQNLDREHAFSDADVRLLTTLAGSLSVALENARLFEEIRQRNSELALISDVRRGLAERLEMQAMFDVMGDRFQEIFDAQVVDIGIVDADGGRMSFPYTIERGVRMVHDPIDVMGFRKVALETREPVVINEDIEAASAAVGQPVVLVGEAAEVDGVRAAAGRRSWGRRDLAPEPGPRARVQRRRRAAADDARRQPDRRARERATVRRDPPAQRRARARERRATRARGEHRDAGEPTISSATGSRRSSTRRSSTSAILEPGTMTPALPVRDRARRPVSRTSLRTSREDRA